GYSVGGCSRSPRFRLGRVGGGARWCDRRRIAHRLEPCAPDGGKRRSDGSRNWAQGAGTEGSLNQRCFGSRDGLRRHAALNLQRGGIRSIDSSDDPGAPRGVADGREGANQRRGIPASLYIGGGGRVSHRRCDQPPSLSIGLSLYSNYRRDRRSDGGGKNPPAEGRGVDSGAGYRCQYGIRLARKFRYDDQALACRAGGGKRRDCRAVGPGGIYIGDEYLGRAQGVLPCHGWGL